MSCWFTILLFLVLAQDNGWCMARDQVGGTERVCLTRCVCDQGNHVNLEPARQNNHVALWWHHFRIIIVGWFRLSLCEKERQLCETGLVWMHSFTGETEYYQAVGNSEGCWIWLFCSVITERIMVFFLFFLQLMNEFEHPLVQYLESTRKSTKKVGVKMLVTCQWQCIPRCWDRALKSHSGVLLLLLSAHIANFSFADILSYHVFPK